MLGTGTERLLPDVELMAAVAARSVGLEIMNTPAACRTFNVLLQEQRRVVAALVQSIISASILARRSRRVSAAR